MKNNIIEAAIKAAISAGAILNDYYIKKVQVSNKESSRDIVSEIDTLVENKIIEILKRYDDSISIITEEQGPIYTKSKDTYWLVDPLDGMVNYVNHIPFFCVSIAYIEKGVIQAGAIYAPLFDDIYYGARSIGVFKNDKAIKIKESSMNESLFAVSFSGKNYDSKKRKDEFILFSKLNDISRGCLRTGSAALNLAYLAEGRFNGAWGKANKYWDIAAGLLIAELAGAKVVTKKMSKRRSLCSYIASVPSIHDNLHEQVKNVLEL